MIGNRQELVLESSLENLREVEKFVEDLSDYYNLNNNYFGTILLSLTEAFKNAVIHRNASDPKKSVIITCDPIPSGLSFSVQDQGRGFDFSSIPDPTDFDEKENPKSGLYLIKKLSDDILFLDGGSLLKIRFQIASINFELSLERAKMLNQYFHATNKKTQNSN